LMPGLAAAPMIPNPGPLLRVVAPRLAGIPGWFNLDDLTHFTLVLETQRNSGLTGDLLELGCYHGRSAAVLAMHLGDDERLVLVDAFDLPLSEPYGDTPSVGGVLRNLRSAVPDLAEGRIHILKGYSREFPLPSGLRVRFAHVDGGHDRQTVKYDLALCASVLVDGGVIVVDDYAHPQHTGVSEGVADFLRADTTFRVLADVNRSGALGRKLYLGRERR
jgi:Methyltransferase domain